MRYATKRSTYGLFHDINIGFGRVPANTRAKVLIENLRMVGVKSSQYLWYQGGNKVGVYDKNWNHQADLPVVATNYEVDKGFSEYGIDGECAAPPPWFDVQFITKGETIKLETNPTNAKH